MKQYTNQLSSLNSTLAQKVESEERNRIQMDKEVRGRVEAQQYFIEHMTRIAGLTQLSQSASEQTTERGLIHACTQVAHRITGADHIEIILRDESGLRFQKIEIDSPDNVNKSSWVSGNDIPWIDEVLTKGRLVAQDTAAENPAWTIDLGKNDTKSAMATPLMASGTLLGVIRVGSKFSNHFDRATQNLVYKFAATVSTNLALLRSLQGLENEIDRADAVLISVLPPSVSRRLKDGETGIAERIDLAGVFFCDLAGFTTYSAKVEPEVVVEMLQGAFAVLEEKCAEHNVEKIKTIGDAFMAVAGVSLPVHDAILTITEFALDAGEALKRHFNQMGLPLGFRIGIHAGPVLAGVIGQERLFFDVWGDAVNLASRLEASGTTSEVRCSDKIQTHLHEHFNFEDCGLLELKGKGSQRVWKIQRTKSTSR